MTSRRQIREAVAGLDDIIEDLRQPLSAEDLAEGWTEEKQRIWLQRFLRYRAFVAAGKAPEGAEYHLMRWMDFDGIQLGPLAGKARAIQRRLWAVFADEAARADWREH
jgi:hypothetical protein